MHLCGGDGRCGLILADMKMHNEREDEAAGESGTGSDEDLWKGEPAPAWSSDCRRGGKRGVGLLGEEDDLTAIRASGEMRERREAFVLGQSVFGERAELVGREVRAGLEVVEH